MTFEWNDSDGQRAVIIDDRLSVAGAPSMQEWENEGNGGPVLKRVAVGVDLLEAPKPPGMDHPAVKLWCDTLDATTGPVRPEDAVKIFGHALDATGYVLVKVNSGRAA